MAKDYFGTKFSKWPKIELRLFGYQPCTWVTSFWLPTLYLSYIFLAVNPQLIVILGSSIGFYVNELSYALMRLKVMNLSGLDSS